MWRLLGDGGRKFWVEWSRHFKGTVSPDILILFMMSIIKSVLFVWPLIPLSFFYSFIDFLFVYKV